jgi:hypothetical protein
MAAAAKSRYNQRKKRNKWRVSASTSSETWQHRNSAASAMAKYVA